MRNISESIDLLSREKGDKVLSLVNAARDAVEGRKYALAAFKGGDRERFESEAAISEHYKGLFKRNAEKVNVFLDDINKRMDGIVLDAFAIDVDALVRYSAVASQAKNLDDDDLRSLVKRDSSYTALKVFSSLEADYSQKLDKYLKRYKQAISSSVEKINARFNSLAAGNESALSLAPSAFSDAVKVINEAYSELKGSIDGEGTITDMDKIARFMGKQQ